MGSFADIEKLQVGDVVPSFEKTFAAVDLFAYGAATWDWARIHYDQEFARSLGFRDIFVDGQQYGAIFAERIITWLGPSVFVTSMNFNFRTLTYRGETLTGTGSVTELVRTDDATTLVLSQQLRGLPGLPVKTRMILPLANLPECRLGIYW